MIRRLLDWLERETGMASAWSRFWAQPLPRGVGWGHILGALALLCVVVLFATGGVMMFYYSPAEDQAYTSVQYIEQHLPFGRFVRALHYWTARLIVLLLILHLLRVFFWAAYKRPRQLVWVSGVVLLLLIIGFGLTGYALPWDQNAYWATVVRLKIADGVPLLGPPFATFLRGGETVGAVTLMRFFVIHVFALPIVLFVLVVMHIRQMHHLGVTPPGVRINEEAGVERPQRLHPDHTWRISVGALVVTLLLVYFAARFPAPLETRADPFNAAYKPHPDFYVLWLHALVELFPKAEFIGSALLPGILVALLLCLPFLDHSPERSPRRRWKAVLAGVLITAAIVGLTIKDLNALPHREELSPLEEQGQALFVQLKCYICHGINGRGGTAAPDLGLTSDRDAKKVEEVLRTPSHLHPATIMPGYDLPPDQMEALVAYLMGIDPASRLPIELSSEKPANHFEQNWPLLHKFEVRKNPEDCGSCHEPFFCQACHQRRRPSSHQDLRWLLFHYGNAAEQPKMCDACHTPDYCQSCHQTMRHGTDWLAQHGARLAQVGDAKEWSGVTMREACYQCHSQQSCRACHQGALPASHLAPDFLQTHGRSLPPPGRRMVMQQRGRSGMASMTAGYAQTQCSSCHSAAFCDNCHRGARPASHQQTGFVMQQGKGGKGGKSGHAREALRAADSCVACHQRSFCNNCHGVPMPHPAGFSSAHIEEARADSTRCQRCHPWSQSACRSCHSRRPPSHSADFRSAHPQRVTHTGDSCQVCHGRNACDGCHRLPMPHPRGFVESHGRLAGEHKLQGPRRVEQLHKAVCSNCHQDQYCHQCHLPEG